MQIPLLQFPLRLAVLGALALPSAAVANAFNPVGDHVDSSTNATEANAEFPAPLMAQQASLDDAAAPSVALAWPVADKPVSGIATLVVTTTGPINAVKWYVDGRQVAWDSQDSFWAQAWDSSSSADGLRRVVAVARTTTGQWIPSRPVYITVQNGEASREAAADVAKITPPAATTVATTQPSATTSTQPPVTTTTLPPVTETQPRTESSTPAPSDLRDPDGPSVLSVGSPAAGAIVSGATALRAEPVGPTSAVKWYIDDVQVGWDSNGAPWVNAWDSGTISDGQHKIVVAARSTSGVWSSSKPVLFNVDNSSGIVSEFAELPVGDLPGWNQVFIDDFLTDVGVGSFPSALSESWTAYPSPWRDTSGKGLYAPEKVVSIEDGILNKDLHSESGQPLVAALTPKIGNGGTNGSLYGRYSVRMRTEQTEGYKMAWLLWPDSGTNIVGAPSGIGGNGEIDFPEMDLNGSHVGGFVHHQDATVNTDQYWTRAAIDFTSWHTYTIEWSPDLVVFLLDGVEVGRTTERVPNTAMHWVLQTETTLFGATPAEARGNVEIDWVAVWSYEA